MFFFFFWEGINFSSSFMNLWWWMDSHILCSHHRHTKKLLLVTLPLLTTGKKLHANLHKKNLSFLHEERLLIIMLYSHNNFFPFFKSMRQTDRLEVILSFLKNLRNNNHYYTNNISIYWITFCICRFMFSFSFFGEALVHNWADHHFHILIKTILQDKICGSGPFGISNT